MFKIQKDLYDVKDDIITTFNNIGYPNIMPASELRKILNGEEQIKYRFDQGVEMNKNNENIEINEVIYAPVYQKPNYEEICQKCDEQGLVWLGKECSYPYHCPFVHVDYF